MKEWACGARVRELLGAERCLMRVTLDRRLMHRPRALHSMIGAADMYTIRGWQDLLGLQLCMS